MVAAADELRRCCSTAESLEQAGTVGACSVIRRLGTEAVRESGTPAERLHSVLEVLKSQVKVSEMSRRAA